MVDVVIQFIEENISTKFGMPFALMCDNDTMFTSTQFLEWAYKKNVTLQYLSNYNPQDNRVA